LASINTVMPAVARKGDQERGPMHCTQPKRQGAFATVFANGIAMSGKGHKNNTHLRLKPGPKCVAHSKPLITASFTVFAEGIRVGRVGDRTSCSKVVRGSRNVFAG
jgi:uncharacterized Zn-binding protein involved in type VI secretion